MKQNDACSRKPVIYQKFYHYGVIDDDRTNKDRNAEQTRWLKWRWPEKWNTTGARVNIPKVAALLPWHLVFVILFTNSCLLIHGLSKSYTVNISGFCVCVLVAKKSELSPLFVICCVCVVPFFIFVLCLCCLTLQQSIVFPTCFRRQIISDACVCVGKLEMGTELKQVWQIMFWEQIREENLKTRKQQTEGPNHQSTLKIFFLLSLHTDTRTHCMV